LHREVAFLWRTELTVAYYQQSGNAHSVPESIEASIAKTGVALCSAQALAGAQFVMLVPEVTRNAWGATLGEKLAWLYGAGQSTLVTQRAFGLDHRALLIGLSEDYALIMSASQAQTGGGAPPPLPRAEDAAMLRTVLLREPRAQTGLRVPAKNQRLWGDRISTRCCMSW
jgi:two-component system capsular synthesis sensor histidine kinase RcsC